ncbi:hypothetical protein Q6293_28485, partial [Klebsiella pneumoniae]|uniref:hypothetical protein n=1 Tax=Klebsiella pneumoniae TaxID=573 RepID=UPI00272FA265
GAIAIVPLEHFDPLLGVAFTAPCEPATSAVCTATLNAPEVPLITEAIGVTPAGHVCAAVCGPAADTMRMSTVFATVVVIAGVG